MGERLEIRPIQYDDLEGIGEIWRKHHSGDFSLPNSRGILTHAVVTNGDGIIAFGLVKVLGEAIIILDLDASLRDKVNSVKLLMDKAFRDSGSVKLEQLHVFVRDPRFSKILREHFNFRPVIGEVLVAEV